MQRPEGIFVRKHCQEPEACLREQRIYKILSETCLPCAKVAAAGAMTFLLTPLPGRNLVEILEHQEATDTIDWAVWDKLAAWLSEFYRLTGFVMQDVNLRNFLYDEQTQTLYGLDFEECAEGEPLSMAALLAAYIRTYAPENTPIKRQISDHVLREFSRQFHISFQRLILETNRQEAFLTERRKSRK